MLYYAEDLDIAPIDLTIVVRVVISFTWVYNQLTEALNAQYYFMWHHHARTRVILRGFPLVSTLTNYLMFITPGARLYCLLGTQQLICDSRVAAYLQDYGYDGITQSADIQRRDSVPARKRHDPPPRVEDGAFRWPRYNRLSKREIIYPAVLEATSPEQFRLSLPNPATRHTNNLLHLYSRRNPHLRLVISLLYVWIRSWDIKQISPGTLYLLLIRFFQV
jgi:hypothetical protein